MRARVLVAVALSTLLLACTDEPSPSPSTFKLPAPLPSFDTLRLMDSLATPASQKVAADLRAVNPKWRVTGPDLDAYAEKVCRVSAQEATTELLDEVPGARTNAAPALLQAVNLAYRHCQVTNPEVLDAAAGQITRVLAANSAAYPIESAPPQSRGPSDFDKAVCAAGGTFATKWASDLKGGRSGVFLLAGLAAAAVWCPGVVGEMTGG
jgi:hypothetical protein